LGLITLVIATQGLIVWAYLRYIKIRCPKRTLLFYFLFLVRQLWWGWGCTIILHFSLSWLIYAATLNSLISMFPSFKSSLTLSFLPRFLFNWILQCSTLIG